MVGLRNILKKIMYKDTCTVYRSERVEREDTFDFEILPVYEEMPCKLSQYGKSISAHRDDTSQKITEDLRLTYDPQYEILENDFIEVLHQGQCFKLVAGTAFKYPTHTELSLRRRKEARQD